MLQAPNQLKRLVSPHPPRQFDVPLPVIDHKTSCARQHQHGDANPAAATTLNRAEMQRVACDACRTPLPGLQHLRQLLQDVLRAPLQDDMRHYNYFHEPGNAAKQELQTSYGVRLGIACAPSTPPSFICSMPSQLGQV